MAQYEHGRMEIGYQERLFGSFVRFTVRTCVLIAIVLLLMAVFLV